VTHENAALECRQIRQRFGHTQVLCGVNLSLRTGERMALIGPNGAGKSTLFHVLSGGQRPTSGQVLLHGRRIDGLGPRAIQRLGLGRSFQVSQLFGRLSVWDHLRCAVLAASPARGVWWRRLDALDEVTARATHWLQLLGLEPSRDRPAMALSYAEQRALELGMTLAGGAEVLLLDEPTAGMSRSETGRFVALLRQVTQGCSVLLVEHDMGVVFELADRVAVLAQGELIACDRPEAVRADPLVQQAYLGQTVGAGTRAQEAL
jgi:branched-chain amino acid transport system ATP-binding protein